MLIDHSLYKDRKFIAPEEVFKLLLDIRKDLHPFEHDKEYFYTIGLSRSHHIRYIDLVSIGTISGTVVEPREVFRMAIHKAVGAGILMAHNHPSGNLTPSEEDKKITKLIKDAGKIIRIPLMDHIIFSNEAFYSFVSEGML